MAYVQHLCPNCGAPLDLAAAGAKVRCSYCAVLLTAGHEGWLAAAPPPQDEALRDPSRDRLWFEGVRYAILGRLARGEGTDVFLARRDGRLSDLVVIKVLRAEGDQDLLAREHEVLASLEKSKAQGAAHFSRLVPQRVGQGTARLGMRGQGGERKVAVHRWRSGFVHTLLDVLGEHPRGIQPEASIWLWKRTLEVLGWCHRSGWVHGAVLPPHVLVHARDHGIALVGFSRAVPTGRPLPAFSASFRDHYPERVWEGAGATESTDITMSARVMLQLLGGDLRRAPSMVPAPLAALLEEHAGGGGSRDAWELRDRVDAVARQVFGKPRFIPFHMSGWT